MKDSNNNTETEVLNSENIGTWTNLKTPQQLRDQVLFNMIRMVLVKQDLTEEEYNLLHVQEQLFKEAQNHGI